MSYGTCSKCGDDAELEAVKFIDEEYGPHNIKTGRKRIAVDYLFCPICGHTEAVDDSFDGPWMSSDLFKKVMEARNN